MIIGLTLLIGASSFNKFQNPSYGKWKSLFDGKTTKGWKGYNQDGIPKSWKVVDGVLEMNPEFDAQGKEINNGDLVTLKDYKDFELELDWKISKNGNSGIMFNVIEDPKFGAPYLTGPEIQILDNEGHPDGKIHKHRAGDLYDLIPCTKETVKSVGEWNHVRFISNQGHLKIYLNGFLSVETQMHNGDWDLLVAGSKFRQWPEFGKSDHGKICLQDHECKVSFKNIRIREIAN